MILLIVTTVIILVANILYIKSTIIGLIFGILYLGLVGYSIGKAIVKSGLLVRIWVGVGMIVLILASAGSIIYYFYKLNAIVIAIILTLLALMPQILFKKIDPIDIETSSGSRKAPSKIVLTVMALYLLTMFSLLFLLFSTQTSSAIRSPFEVISPIFFIGYYLGTAMLLFVLVRANLGILTIFLTVVHVFISVSLALIVYKLGYGFDPLLHQAAEKIIFQQGYVEPKTIYYIGQYSIVTNLSHLFQISASLIDKLLLPMLFSIYLSPIVYFSIKQKFNIDTSVAAILSTAFLAVPFSIFINTTPQGLANLFLLILIFLTMNANSVKHYYAPIATLLCVAILLTHPLAGIPAIIFLITCYILKQIQDDKRFIVPLLLWVIVSSVLIPLSFSLIGQTILDISNDTDTSWATLTWVNKFDAIFDFVYFYGLNLKLILIILSVIGFIMAIINKAGRFAWQYCLTFIIILLNAFFLSHFTFLSVVNYEQNNYIERLVNISFYFLWPLIIYLLVVIFKKIFTINDRLLDIFTILLLASAISASLYLSYPRVDQYWDDRGFNTSYNDILAVRSIDAQAEGKDYIVLANQAVSAAAIRELGFKKYYTLKNGEKMFFYPIPTSSPLYKLYIDYVDNIESEDTIKTAMKIANVKEAYLVLNRYWWSFPVIVKKANHHAIKSWTIDNGEIHIFKYVLSES